MEFTSFFVHLKMDYWIILQAIFPVSRSYSSVPSAPRLKLISTPEMKSFFSVDTVKLPAWVDEM
jgi:BRCA1-A complex subunit BRE